MFRELKHCIKVILNSHKNYERLKSVLKGDNISEEFLVIGDMVDVESWSFTKDGEKKFAAKDLEVVKIELKKELVYCKKDGGEVIIIGWEGCFKLNKRSL